MGFKKTSAQTTANKSARAAIATTTNIVTIAPASVTSVAPSIDGQTSLSIGGSGPSAPTITNVQVANSTFVVIPATAVDVTGGYITITGTGFESNSSVYINSILVTSVYVSSTKVNATIPETSAGAYNVFLFNSTGVGTIYNNYLLVSPSPTWSQTTTYASLSLTISQQLSATGDAPISYSVKPGTSLPTGLSISSSGLITGTVPSINTYTFTIRATDAQYQTTDQLITLIATAQVTIDYLVVAGGGGGGNDVGGGGGAGGVIYQSGLNVTAGLPYTITVGAGGSGAGGGVAGSVGANSVLSGPSITTKTAIGGGGGGSWSAISGTTGGSGGGTASNLTNTVPGTAGQGYSGGQGGGGGSGNGYAGASGGGGAGGAGGNGQDAITGAASTTVGNGGIGLADGAVGNLLTSATAGQLVSTTRYIAGGGGYSSDNGTNYGAGGNGGGAAGNGVAGTPNTGGGGGGGGSLNGGLGGNGGSGIVIIRYASTESAANTTGSPTVTVTGGYRTYKFTGTGTITF